MTKTFDEKLNDEQRRKAEILRRSMRPEAEYTRPDPPAPGKIERFDDIFNSKYDLARSHELRRRAKAELYWDQAGIEEKEAIRLAVAAEEPYKGNELFSGHFMNRRINDIISDDNVIRYIQEMVLALT